MYIRPDATQFYLPEAGEDPQKALTALMADYGLVCGASEAARSVFFGCVCGVVSDVSCDLILDPIFIHTPPTRRHRRAAHSTHFTSPVYTYVNLWAPSTPIPRADKQVGSHRIARARVRLRVVVWAAG